MAQAVAVEAMKFPPVTMQMIDDDYRIPQRSRSVRSFSLPSFSRRPAMVIAGVASLAVLCLGGYFLPKAVAARSTVGRLESEATRLSAAYEQCAKDLKSKAGTIDTYTQSAVDAYNHDVAECTRLGKEKKQTIDQLNKLYGN